MSGAVSMKDEVFKVKDRLALWKEMAPSIFDDNLDKLKKSILTVFKSDNPKLELEKDERIFANIRGKVSKYSPELCQGLAETVALLGNYSDELVHCSTLKRNNIAPEIVREIFQDMTWKRWASLSNYLSLFAEAAPDVYLSVIDNLLSDTEVLTQIQQEEGDGLSGEHYWTGITTSLEVLAWDDVYFARVVDILSRLAAMDKGGNFYPRPSSSLVDIFLPWRPQTLAPIEKRIAIAKVLVAKTPSVGWEVLSKLLYSEYQITSGTRRPSWRKPLPKDFSPKVSGDEYNDSLKAYEEILIEMAKDNIAYVTEIIPLLDRFSQESFSKAINVLKSLESISLSDDTKEIIWTALLKFIAKHRRFRKAQWVRTEDELKELQEICDALKPQEIFNLYKHLFTIDHVPLYSDDNYQSEEDRIAKEKAKAIKEIYNQGCLPLVLDFCKIVSCPYAVGYHLAALGTDELDNEIMPSLLETDKNYLDLFLTGYLSKRFSMGESEWLEKFSQSTWELSLKVSFLLHLPFNALVWRFAKTFLAEHESMYWQQLKPQAWIHSDKIEVGVKKALQYARPVVALNCLFVMNSDNLPIDFDLSINALLDSLNDDDFGKIDRWRIVKIIEAIQPLATTTERVKKLQQVEFAYLELLNSADSEITPVTLEDALATDASFFHQILCACYRPENSRPEEELSTQQKYLAKQSYILLSNWKAVPGVGKDGVFNKDFFNDWLSQTISLCEKSGHTEIAQSTIGKILFYAPKDPDGLWIHKGIAEILDRQENGKMRHGFYLEAHNSRGAHWVDTTGEEDLKLARSFHEKASDLEDAGFLTFSVTLRQLAKNYEEESQRSKEMANKE